MFIKKVILFISLVVAMAFTNRDSAIKSTSVILTTESSLMVRGTTNVNSFTCGYNVNKFKNPISVVYYLIGDKITFSKAALILDNNCFDCGGKGINSDFQKILKSDKHPQIFLFLKEISQIENSPDVQASIDIQMAGLTKNFKVPVNIIKNNNFLITGDLALKLSDFNLETPKKFFGLISVNDKIEIFFQLAVKEH